MKLVELQEQAKKLGIKYFGKYKKEELEKKIQEVLSNKEETNIGKENIEKSNENDEDIKNEIKIDDIKIEDLSKEKKEMVFEDSDFDNYGYDCVGLNRDFSFKKCDGKNYVVFKEGSYYILDNKDMFVASGYLDTLDDGYGFIRDSSLSQNDKDVYVSSTFIKKFDAKNGDHILGIARKSDESKFPPLVYMIQKNFTFVDSNLRAKQFEKFTPLYPNKRLKLSEDNNDVSTRIIDMFCPIGLGQRALIVAPPKAGKTTLLKNIAKVIDKMAEKDNIELMVLLVDERPEEVTDIASSINSRVIASTFDQPPANHIRVAEFALEIAKSKVEAGKNIVILLDSITRLARAYNLVVPSSGKILSGGFDPSALYKPKKFFGAARNTKQAGSLTIIATALVDTGSRMDDLIYEEFKGTGNMELHLDRTLSEFRIFPSINILKSGTRKEELLYTSEELKVANILRYDFAKLSEAEQIETFKRMVKFTKDNDELVSIISKNMSAKMFMNNK